MGTGITWMLLISTGWQWLIATLWYWRILHRFKVLFMHGIITCTAATVTIDATLFHNIRLLWCWHKTTRTYQRYHGRIWKRIIGILLGFYWDHKKMLIRNMEVRTYFWHNRNFDASQCGCYHFPVPTMISRTAVSFWIAVCSMTVLYSYL